MFGQYIWLAGIVVMGVIRPKIYLPSSLSQDEMSHVLAHERHHIRRGDPIFRVLAFVALCLHWFNPLVWVAFAISRKDMEMSCDEAVMREMDSDIRAKYSESLLRFATGRKHIIGAPLAFGEGDIKERIVNVMKYKKPAIWITAIAAVLCVVVVILFAFNAEQDGNQDKSTGNDADVSDATDESENEIKDAESVTAWQADLDGDGTAEVIKLDVGELETNGATAPWIESADGCPRGSRRI